VAIILLLKNIFPELIQSLVRKFSFLNKDDSFIQFFMDEVLEYSVKYGNRISEFLDWWEINRSKKSITYPESMDAVRVLTVHKAKGLQYPVVIIPDADFKLRNTKRFLWADVENDFIGKVSVFPLPVQADLESTIYGHLYQKEMADSLLDMVNLLYVATTRPEDRLYLISEKPANEPEKLNSITALLVKFLKVSGIWNGFVPYEFGDDMTTKDIPKTPKEQIGEFQYTPVINTQQKQLSIKRPADLKWNTQGANPNLLRAILCDINYIENVPAVLNKYYQNGILNEYEKIMTEKEVQAILSNEEIADFFSRRWKVYKSKQISSGGKFTYTIDRLLIDKNDNKAVIVNYQIGDDRDAHIKNIIECARLLAPGGYSAIEPWIINVSSKEIIKVNG
jgi:hypothetical protein